MAAGAEAYGKGEQVGLGVQFGTAERPFDPQRVEFRVRDPEGRQAILVYGTDPSVLRVAPGAYQVVIVASVPGRWVYRFAGSGRGAQGAHDGYFDVFDLDDDSPA